MSDESATTTESSKTPEANREAQLREALKRCPPETIVAALAFEETKDPSLVPTVVMGIVERFLDPEVVDKLKSGDDSVRFMEELGMDSLTMFEAVMLVEEALDISIKTEELAGLRTVGDMKSFIAAKVSGEQIESSSTFYPLEEVAAAMPQQDPFMFLQSAEIWKERATGVYEISGNEDFLAGHFKNDPVFPASILLEALGQLGVLHFLKTVGLDRSENDFSIFLTGTDGVRCHRVCRPGEKLELAIDLKRRRDPMMVYSGKITVGGEKAAVAEEISLVFVDKKEAEKKAEEKAEAEPKETEQ